MVLPDCWKLGWSGIEHKGGKVTGGMGSGSSREDQATPHGARDVVNWQSYEDRALATCPSGEAQVRSWGRLSPPIMSKFLLTQC
jgi:hypothetical protein